jgi:hypothetical protein
MNTYSRNRLMPRFWWHDRPLHRWRGMQTTYKRAAARGVRASCALEAAAQLSAKSPNGGTIRVKSTSGSRVYGLSREVGLALFDDAPLPVWTAAVYTLEFMDRCRLTGEFQ